MEYGKIIDETLEYATPFYTLEDNSVISGFNLSPEIMEKYGYKKIIKDKPSYDFEKQYILIRDYTEDEDSIVINYDVFDMDFAEKDTIDEKIKTIEITNETQDELINTTMLATDEIFTLIEPLLSESLSSEKEVDKIAELYLAMVKRKLKTIEEIPNIYKIKVQELLV